MAVRKLTNDERSDLRDVFAAKAMQAVVTGAITHTKGVRNEGEQHAIARFSYGMAYAMLAEREKP